MSETTYYERNRDGMKTWLKNIFPFVNVDTVRKVHFKIAITRIFFYLCFYQFLKVKIAL